MIACRESSEGRAVQASDLSFGSEFATERLLLRPPRRTDAGALHEAIAETLPQLIRWLPWARPGHSRLDTRRYLRGARMGWARRNAFEFIVSDLESEQIVGVTSLHRVDWARRCAGLGYWIRQSAQRRGFALEAARASAEYGFHRLGLHRLELHIALANAASHAVANGLGARREGVARDAEVVDGRFLDHVQYALLSTDEATGWP